MAYQIGLAVRELSDRATYRNPWRNQTISSVLGLQQRDRLCSRSVKFPVNYTRTLPNRYQVYYAATVFLPDVDGMLPATWNVMNYAECNIIKS